MTKNVTITAFVKSMKNAPTIGFVRLIRVAWKHNRYDDRFGFAEFKVKDEVTV